MHALNLSAMLLKAMLGEFIYFSEEEEEEEELECYYLSALYRLFKSLYLHTYHA